MPPLPGHLRLRQRVGRLHIEGTATLSYDLTAIGEPATTIEVPPDCPPGLIDLAAPAGATTIVDLPGLQTLATEMPIPDAVAFYREQLPLLGWAEQPALFEDDAATIIEFIRGREHLLLRVTAGDPATRVDLALTFD